MAIKLGNTADARAHSVKILCYGFAGTGKTTMIKTLPDPVIISAEGGLLSLAGESIPFVTVDDMPSLVEAYTWLSESAEARKYQSVAIDSISEIAEVVLAAEKKKTKDPRAAYGEMQDQMARIVRGFRDLEGRHVYMTAKAEKSQDERGMILFAPSMPGNKAAQAMPYFFDEVLAVRCEKDADGNMQRALLCESDGIWQAKDRSGKLAKWEAPDMGAIITKILGGGK